MKPTWQLIIKSDGRAEEVFSARDAQLQHMAEVCAMLMAVRALGDGGAHRLIIRPENAKGEKDE